MFSDPSINSVVQFTEKRLYRPDPEHLPLCISLFTIKLSLKKHLSKIAFFVFGFPHTITHFLRLFPATDDM